ncbi:hypothetical protein M3231_11075 [Neobacillus mesonae]|nr:hypothetical protein [Neobacillus mesonae]
MLNKIDAHRFFYYFIKGRVTLIELEQWLYANDDLEVIFGDKDYLELISRNYKDKYAYEDTVKQIRELIHIGYFEQERIVTDLQELIHESDKYLAIMDSLYDDYCSGYSFLRYIGLMYITTSDEYKNILRREPDKFRKYSRPINREAGRLLEFFRVNQLRIEQEHEYIDLRKEEDRIELYRINEMMK